MANRGCTEALNITHHCNTSSDGDCTGLSQDIRNCQNKDIKVMLSIGGVGGSYSLSSIEDAKNVADYLWNNFLGDNSSSRPLGDAVLDGIDFNIQIESIKYLSNYSSTFDSESSCSCSCSVKKKVYLSASPQRSHPESHRALYTNLFDYLWIRFYNNISCDYNNYRYPPTYIDLLNSWRDWADSMPIKKVFLGLPASSTTAESGYIPVNVLTSGVLPILKTDPKYGGVVLWNKYYDDWNRYSSSILNSV